MKIRASTTVCVCFCLIGATPLAADWRDEIGFTRLKLLAGAELPGAPSQGISQVEASESKTSTLCIPDTTSALFSGKRFLLKTGATGVSLHATHVATNFYGSASQIPGACEVDLHYVNSWLNTGFLNLGTNSPPVVQSRAVQNHSWVGSIDSFDTEASQRLDFAIDRDGLLCVVGLNNEATNPLPELLCQTYNTISVGRDDGKHSAGLTTIDGLGRMKPDIVAPSAAPEYATSWTTPMVAGAGGLLHAKLSNAYSITGANLPRLIKALLLASATKNTVPDWNNFPASPLDSIYGAGELNINHAYNALRAGRQIASDTTVLKSRGWAAQSVVAGAPKTYFFSIAAGAPSTPFSAALTWHRIITDNLNGPSWGDLTASLENLSLRLYQASGFPLGSQIAASLSNVDNVELVYQSALPPEMQPIFGPFVV